MKLEQRQSGLVVPAEKPKERHAFVQRDITTSQLPGFLERLSRFGGTLESVFKQRGDFDGGRFAVAYLHTEELEFEIYC